MKRSLFIVGAVALALLIPVAPLAAFGRDTDGSRMQARPMALDSSVSDRLAPPNDAVDWRYLRLSDARDVTLTVDAVPPSVSVEVNITNAMGKSIARGRTADGKFTTRRRLDPGLYYISVSASRPASYQLSVR